MDEEVRWVERALLEAVVADPSDDAARLVYADWLLQRGEPLGELIVAQCLIEREGRKAEAYRRARTQEQVLLTRHRTRWLKRMSIPVGPTRPHVDVTFRRGLIADATLTFGEVRSLSKRLDLLPLEHLRIVPRRDSLALGGLRWLAQQPFAARLSRLTLRIPRGEVTLDARAAFAACLARQKADHGAIWSDRFADGFLHPTVLDLVLDGSWPGYHVDFLQGFSLPPRLERLAIVDGRHLASEWENLFERICVDPRASRLSSVSFARLSSWNARTLFARWPFAGVRQVHLGIEEGAAIPFERGVLGTLRSFSTTLPIDRLMMRTFEHAPLEELSAMGGVTADAAPLLDAPKVHTLHVGGGRAEAIVGMLESMPALSSLRLERVPLEDADAERIATMPSLAGLFELHLEGALLSDASVLALLRSETLADVPWIDLGDSGRSTELRLARIERSPAWSAGLRASLDPRE